MATTRNGIDLSLTVQGGEPIAQALAEIGTRGAENAIRAAVRKSIKPMVKTARILAPVLTGALSKSIIPKILGFDKDRKVKAYVGIKKGTVDVKVSYDWLEEKELKPEQLGGRIIQTDIRRSKRKDEKGNALVDLARTKLVVRKKPEAYGWRMENLYGYMKKTKQIHQQTYVRGFKSTLLTEIEKQKTKLAAKRAGKK